MKVRSIAGDTGGTAEHVDDYGPDARFDGPKGIAVDPVNPYHLYIADYDNQAIRLLDLDTGYVDTFVDTLASNPWHVAISDDYIAVTTRGGPDDGSIFNLAAPYHLYVFDRDGTTAHDKTLTIPAGDIAWWAEQGVFVVKYPLYQLTGNGWYALTPGSWAWAVDGTNSDGAFAGDRAVVNAGGRVWGQIEYLGGGFNNGFTDRYDLGTGDPGPAACRTLAVSPWSPAGQVEILGVGGGRSDITVYTVSASAYVGVDERALEFSVENFYGVAVIPGGQDLLFSGLNQIWMTSLAGRWHTRRT